MKVILLTLIAASFSLSALAAPNTKKCTMADLKNMEGLHARVETQWQMGRTTEYQYRKATYDLIDKQFCVGVVTHAQYCMMAIPAADKLVSNANAMYDAEVITDLVVDQQIDKQVHVSEVCATMGEQDKKAASL
jgi:hypothetical protein